MQRLDAPPKRRSPLAGPGTRLTLAAAVVIAAALVLGVVVRTDAPPAGDARPTEQAASATAGADPDKARLRELRREHDALMRDLRALREQSRSSSPLLYLGGTDQLDVVVDLGRVGRSPSGDASLARPASHQTRP
jgi:hypothetical protein